MVRWNVECAVIDRAAEREARQNTGFFLANAEAQADDGKQPWTIGNNRTRLPLQR
jgi:hypothetical protein